MTTRIIAGDCRAALAELPSQSVHMCVTSPPYWGLRDYKVEPQVWGGDPMLCGHEWDDSVVTKKSGGVGSSGLLKDGRNEAQRIITADRSNSVSWLNVSQGAFCRHCNAWRGSLGLEPTLGLYLDHMVEVCREIRRVLRKDGTFWLVVGDSFCAHPGQRKTTDKAGPKQISNTASVGAPSRHDAGLKPKDLMMVPARLAIRLQEDGWWVRQEIQWCKAAPMPESVTDRPTSATEKVFLLSRSARYFYDAEAVKEAVEESQIGRVRKSVIGGSSWQERQQHSKGGTYQNEGSRNLRNWWLLGPEPYAGPHFAVFPTEIPRRAILAGTSAKGVCPKCGAPWQRDLKFTGDRQLSPDLYGRPRVAVTQNTRKTDGVYETIGWQPTCRCNACDPVPATILDPFLGAGTTALVADRLGRNCIGIELNPADVTRAEERLRADAGMFAEVAAE